MQHVLTLSKIFLVFCFALVTFGCTANKDFDEAKEVLAAVYSYRANGELSRYVEYEYDSNGNKTKGSLYNANGELSGFYGEYEYDSNGNITKMSDYNENGELSSYIVYLYKSI